MVNASTTTPDPAMPHWRMLQLVIDARPKRFSARTLAMDLLVSFGYFASGREPDPLPGLHLG